MRNKTQGKIISHSMHLQFI